MLLRAFRKHTCTTICSHLHVYKCTASCKKTHALPCVLETCSNVSHACVTIEAAFASAHFQMSGNLHRNCVLCCAVRKHMATHVVLGLPFVHICKFLNAGRSASKSTDLLCDSGAGSHVTHVVLVGTRAVFSIHPSISTTSFPCRLSILYGGLSFFWNNAVICEEGLGRFVLFL